MNRNKMLASLAVVAAGLGTGCSTYNQQNKATPMWRQGNVPAAVREFTAQAEKKQDTKDTVIWRLEQGAALRAAGQFKESIAAFEAAEERIEKYEEQAKVKAGRETGAVLSNQANLPYEGRDYDKVMLNTYKALNYIQLCEFEKARPEIIRAFQRQQDAVEENKKRIEKEQKEIAEASKAKAKEKASAEQAKSDPRVKGKLDAAYAGLDNLKPYADYVNPFTVYLDGLYFLHFATGASDLERARKSFERVLSFTEGNAYVQQDLQDVEKVLRGEPLQPTTYIIFETGCAPSRDQIRIDVPLFIVGAGNLPYAGAAFPILKTEGNYLSSLTISANGTTVSPALVADFDSVVGQSFKNELPTVVTKTLLSTTIKAAASYAINKAASDQDAMVGLLAKIITTATQVAMNIADTRTWTTLPKEVHVCRLPTPADQPVVISAPGGGQKVEVKVEPNSMNLIFVKAISTVSPLIVSQVKLNQHETVLSAKP